jgi:hypothetical protein
MPREARLFSSSSGSVVRAFLKFRANIPPRWIKNARTSRKRVEPEVIESLGKLNRIRKTRSRARVAMETARKETRSWRSVEDGCDPDAVANSNHQHYARRTAAI